MEKDKTYFLGLETSILAGGHMTGIRVYGENGIELYDSNRGIFRFKSKHDFVNFMALYLVTDYAGTSQISLIATPYKNYRHEDNVKRSHPPAADQETHIKMYKERVTHLSNTQKKDFQVVAQHVLDARACELPGATSLIETLKKKIEAVISRMQDEDKQDDKAKEKIQLLQTQLTSNLSNVQSRGDLTDQQKTCLLFVLMEDSLKTKRGLFTPASYTAISQWMNTIGDRESIDKFRRMYTADKIESLEATHKLINTR